LPETLTESFCERCGTRYEFKAPTRLNPLRKTRGILGGLKNYLTSQDDLSDAMNDAMRTEEGQLATAQLEAFHESFNFCIDCRQYTCVNCWNDGAGRCRSCAPVAGTDDLAERLAASVGSKESAQEHAHVHEPMVAESEPEPIRGFDAWPSSDLPEPTSASNGHVPDAWPTDDLEQPPLVIAEVEPEPVAAEVEVEPEPVAAEVEVEVEPEPVAAEAPRLTVVAWESDTEYEVYQPEPVAAEVEPEPVAAEVEVEPEPVAAEVEVEPEPVAAEVEVEPEPEPEPRRIAPISETILRFPRDPRPAAPPSEDVSERIAATSESPEVAARRAQMDLLGLGDPGEGPVTPQRPAVMPYRSRGAAVTSNEIAARAGGSSFWEASAREVAGAAAPIGVQNCTQCSLSLSANARFCRRCGTRQAQSA
jgi:hypothetical protein